MQYTQALLYGFKTQKSIFQKTKLPYHDSNIQRSSRYGKYGKIMKNYEDRARSVDATTIVWCTENVNKNFVSAFLSLQAEKGRVMMRKVKALKWMILGVLALTIIVGTSNYADAANGAVNISKKNFPCKEFRTAIKEKYDKNGDGKLSKSERKKVTWMYLHADSSKKISLKGIEHFTNLTTFYLSTNNIQDLDLSQNNKLVTLQISAKTVSNLKLSGEKLANFSIYVNKLKGRLSFKGFKKIHDVFFEMGNFDNVDFSGSSIYRITTGNYPVHIKKLKLTNCKKLRKLRLTPLGLKSLDLKGTNGLQVLSIKSNAIHKIDVSKMKNLRELGLEGAKITKLSVKNNKKLEKLNVNGTKINTLNLSANKKLTTLCYGNNKRIKKMISVPHPERIKYLDISNTKISNVDLSKYTALQHLYLSALSISALDVKNCTELITLHIDKTKHLKALDLANQTKLENIELDRSNVEKLDIRNSLLIRNQGEFGTGLGFRGCLRLREIIANETWKELETYQDYAKSYGLTVQWIIP